MLEDWEIRKELIKQENEVKEMKKLINSYKNLMKFGEPSLEFNVYDGDIKEVLTLLESLESWNNFDGITVAKNLKILFEMLPKLKLQEGNPNNGKPEFDKIIIEGDETVILKAFRLKPFEENIKNQIEIMINEIGRKMKADEISLIEEPHNFGGIVGSYSYYIRFWWD